MADRETNPYITLRQVQLAEDAKANGPNFLSGGLKAGVESAAGVFSSGVGMVGKLTGSQTLQDLGRAGAQESDRKAAELGRPDLENLSDQSLGSAIPYLGYQIAKSVPTIATVLTGAALAPEVAIPGAVGRGFAALPRFLGGGAGVEAGAAAAQRLAALTIGGTPLSAASLYHGADEKEGGATFGDAIKSVAMAPVAAALFGAELSPLGEGGVGLGKRLLARGMGGAATGIVQGAGTQALADMLRPDLTTHEKLARITEAGLNNAAIGGAIGMSGGLFGRGTPHADPTSVPTADIAAHVDQQLRLSGPDAQLGLPAPGEGATRGDSYLRNSDRMGTNATELQPDAGSNAIEQAKQGDLRYGRKYEQDPQRPFESAPLEDLQGQGQVAADYLNKHAGTDVAQTDTYAKVQERLQAVSDELAARGHDPLIKPDVSSSSAEAGVPGSDVTGGSANSSAPVSAELSIPDDFFKGVRTSGSYSDAKTIGDVVAIHEARLADGDATKSSALITERLKDLGHDVYAKDEAAAPEAGAADPTAEAAPADAPSAVAATTTDPTVTAALAAASARDAIATREPAAPANLKGGDATADPKFQADFKARIEGTADGATELKNLGDLATDPPKNAEEAKQRIFHALGDNIGEASYGSVERLAKEHGLLSKDGTLSDEGVRVARNQIPAEAAKTAAIASGHTTQAAVAAFDKGARGEPIPKRKTEAVVKAFKEGNKWASDRKSGPVPEALDAAGTREVLGRIGAGKELRPDPEARARQLAEAKLNDHIDANYSANHTPGEMAQLKTLAREGRFTEIPEAARRMKEGETVLANAGPERPAFVGAKPDSILSAKAMIEQLRAASGLREAIIQGADQRTKGENVKALKAQEAAEASYRERLRQAIHEAGINGEISAGKRIGLLMALQKGDVVGVEKQLESPSRAPSTPVRNMLNGVARIAAGDFGKRVVPAVNRAPSKSVIEMATRGDVDGTLRAIKASSKNPGYRLIAGKLEGLMDNVKLVMRDENPDRWGEAQLEDHGGSTINIFGKSGMTEETLLHEMLHAYVQQRWGGLADYHERNRELLGDTFGRRGDKAIEQFQDLWQTISDKLEQDHPELVKNEMWANQVYEHPDEMLSWVMTNADAQAALRNMTIGGGKVSLWTKTVDFFRNLIGLPNSKSTLNALDQILTAGHAVLDAGYHAEQGNKFQKDFAAGIHQQAAENAAGTFDYNKPFLGSVRKQQITVSDTNLAMRAVGARADAIEKALRAVKADTLSEKLTKAALAWADPFHIVAQHGHLFESTDPVTGARRNGPDEILRAQDLGHTIQAQLAQHLVLGADVLHKLENGTKEEKGAAAATTQFMRNSAIGYRVDRSWADQAKTVREGANAEAVRKLHASDYRQYQAMAKAGTSNAYTGLRDTNDAFGYGHMAGELHNAFVRMVPEAGKLDAYARAPGDNFQEAMADPSNRLQQDPSALRGFFAKELTDRLDAIDRHVAGERATALGLDAKEAAKMTENLGHLEEMVKTYRDHMQTMDEHPYFHLGRFGNHFVDIKIAKDAEGNVRPEMVAELARHLRDVEGHHGITIMPENDSDHAFIRVENAEAQAALYASADKLRGKGVLDETGGEPIVAGNRERSVMRNPGAENWARDLITKIQTNTSLKPAEKTRLVGELQSMQLNLLSDNSLAQSLAKREGTHGWDSDMMRSWNNRGRIGASGIAGQTTAPKIASGMAHMGAAIKSANQGPIEAVSLKDRSTMVFVRNEFVTREAQARLPSENPFLDRASAVVQASYLGASISFVLTQLSQPLVTTLPHLGAKYGFVRSADALARSTSLAFKVLKAVWAEGAKTSRDHRYDAPITAEALRHVEGMTPAQREFILRVVNTGQLDISGAARQQQRAVDSPQGGRLADGVDKTLRWGSSFGYYSETLTRLTAALANHALDGEHVSMVDKVENARNTLKQSLFDYSPGSRGRMFGKQGVFGVATPLMTKFMTYTANITGKLYREFHGAISKDSTPAERLESAKFLMGHMAMMTVLAGTTGLPLTTALSSIYDRTHDALFGGSEPSDIRASYRNYLEHMFGEHMFGHTAGAMIAGGVTRGIGVDLNQRLGEQDILPFSKFLADRRGFKEASKDLAFRTYGAPLSLVKSWANGMGRVVGGDVMGGLGEALPHVLAGPVKAFGMYNNGYVDSHGTKLPITPSGRDVLAQALGFQPSNKVDYTEAAHDVQVRGALITKEGGSIKSQLANAIADHDTASVNDLVSKAIAFDKAHPTFAILPQIGAAVTRKVQDPAIARAIGAPLGVKPQDIGARKISEFAAIGN